MPADALPMEPWEEDGHWWIPLIVVPWDEQIIVRGHEESFAPGAFDAQFPAGRPRRGRDVPVYWRHDESQLPVGRIDRSTCDAAGQWALIRMATSPRALEAAALCVDGTLRGCSPEVAPIQPKYKGADVGHGRITRGVMRHIALTPTPAYTTAGTKRRLDRAIARDLIRRRYHLDRRPQETQP